MVERLSPAHYRSIYSPDTPITRANIETMLTQGIECLMSHGKWWRIRRNGKTRTWKRDPRRIYIPFKMGMYGYGAITESDFIEEGTK